MGTTKEVLIPALSGFAEVRLHSAEWSRSSELDYFVVEVVDRDLKVALRVYAYLRGEELIRLFEEMARRWDGWTETLTWQSLERELTIACTCDGLGHVRLEFILENGWQVRAFAWIEAGQLERRAREVRDFLRGDDAAA